MCERVREIVNERWIEIRKEEGGRIKNKKRKSVLEKCIRKRERVGG